MDSSNRLESILNGRQFMSHGMNFNSNSSEDRIEQASKLCGLKRYSEAESLLRGAALQGDVNAQVFLGNLYFTGSGISRESATKWLQLAADHDHPEALYRLAMLSHRDGAVGPPDCEAGISLLKRASELGSAGAQRDLACKYATGDGLEQNLQLARSLYLQASEGGHPDAQFNAGLMLILGEGGPKSISEGVRWIELAAENGETVAIQFLIYSFRSDGHGIPIDEKKAHSWEQISD